MFVLLNPKNIETYPNHSEKTGPVVAEFYQRTDVAQVARELLGKVLYSQVDGLVTSGMIVETEAYSWKERGCHAYNNKKTQRNEVMFKDGGRAYVYLCYGIHNLFNIVTNFEGVAEAVLIRALEPLDGMEIMKERMHTEKSVGITRGPGKLSKAMAIDRSDNGQSLVDGTLWVEEGQRVVKSKVVASPRIGIDYAGVDAALPWRFFIKDNPWVSGPKVNK